MYRKLNIMDGIVWKCNTPQTTQNFHLEIQKEEKAWEVNHQKNEKLIYKYACDGVKGSRVCLC